MNNKSQKQTREDLENKVFTLFKDAPPQKKKSSNPKAFWIAGVLVLLTAGALAAWMTMKTECNIKGNIDSAGNRYYYMPFDPYYESAKVSARGEKILCSEEEAIDQGWVRKSTSK